MYRWRIDFVLKSGHELTVYYRGTEATSSDVARKMLTGNENSLNGFANEDETKNIFVKVGEIAAASISAA